MNDLKINDFFQFVGKSDMYFTFSKFYVLLKFDKDEYLITTNTDSPLMISKEDFYIGFRKAENIQVKNENKVENRSQEQRPSGGATHYYELPKNATELKHLIRHKKMSHPIGEAFCSLYRLNDNGEYKRNLEKAKYYIETELQYLEEGRK